MDAFGIASGLVAIHTRRPDNSFLEFVRRDNPDSPFFSGFSKANGLPVDIAGHDRPGHGREGRRRPDLQEHSCVGAAGPGADRHQERQLGDRALSRQLGRQSGRLVTHAGVRRVRDRRSANGERADPRAAQPVHRQSAAAAVSRSPASIWRARARARRFSRRSAPAATRLRNQTIYPVSKLGVDPNRTMVNTSVSRYGLAALVMEACAIYGLNHQGQPGADWCVPKGDWQARLDEYFRDTPRRVAEGTNGYKADVLHGIWAQAPYLHNGSVPTLGQLMCPSTRPRSIPARKPVLRRSAGRLRMVGPADGPVCARRDDSDQGVRHDGPRQGQHRPHASAPTSALTRPASIRLPIARRSKPASSDRASARCSRT